MLCLGPEWDAGSVSWFCVGSPSGFGPVGSFGSGFSGAGSVSGSGSNSDPDSGSGLGSLFGFGPVLALVLAVLTLGLSLALVPIYAAGSILALFFILALPPILAPAF